MEEGQTFHTEWAGARDPERKHDRRGFTLAHQVKGGNAPVFNEKSKIRWDKFSKVVMDAFMDIVVCGDSAMDIDEPEEDEGELIQPHDAISPTSTGSGYTLVNAPSPEIWNREMDTTPRASAAQTLQLQIPEQIQNTQPQKAVSGQERLSQEQVYEQEQRRLEEIRRQSERFQQSVQQQQQPLRQEQFVQQQPPFGQSSQHPDPGYYAPLTTTHDQAKSWLATEFLSDVDQKLSKCQREFHNQMEMMRSLNGDVRALKGLAFKTKHAGLPNWNDMELNDSICNQRDDFEDIAMEFMPAIKDEYMY